MKSKDRVLQMKLSEIGLSRTASGRLASYAKDGSHFPNTPDDPECVTVAETMWAFGTYGANRSHKSLEGIFTRRLVELGLTRADWVYLPQSTMTDEVMYSIPKKDWLEIEVQAQSTLP